MVVLKHIEVANTAYFVTTNTESDKRWFEDEKNAQILLDALVFLRTRGDFKLYAFVIMPDHLHMILWPKTDLKLPVIMHSLKSYSAKVLSKATGRSGKVWQDGYYEHGIRNRADFDEKVNYIHCNPVKARLVSTVEEYRFSSVHNLATIDSYPY